MSPVKCPATDLYPDVANHCQRLKQTIHFVKPLLGYSNLWSLSRQAAVVLKTQQVSYRSYSPYPSFHIFLLEKTGSTKVFPLW